MAAVDSLGSALPASGSPPVTEAAGRDFAWRVLILLNLFRLAIGALLLAIFYLVDTPRIVGQSDPTLAWQALIGLLTMGCVELALLYRRYPTAELQTYLQFCTDLTCVTLLI